VHDWNYLLGSLHLLPKDTSIAAAVHAIALGALVLSLLLGGWLCSVMARSRPAGSPAAP